MSEVLIDEATLLRLQKLAALGEVSAGISHETRNLLTVIVGFTQVASQRSKTLETAVHYLALVEREAKRCIELHEQQLGLAKLEAAGVLCDATEVVREIATTAGYQAELRRIVLDVQLAETPAIRARRSDLQQVLLNLVLNALHATPVGGSILLSVRHVDDCIELAVCDSGPGVPPEIRGSIFEPFFTTKGAEGTGLGLAVCRQLVEASGGTLRLDATYTRGARFVVTVPVAR
jgi:signal transduction histidine kinase